MGPNLCVYIYIYTFPFSALFPFILLLFPSFLSITKAATAVTIDLCVYTHAFFFKTRERETTSTLSPPRRPLPIQRHRPSSSAKNLTNARVCKEREISKKIDIRYCCICFLYRARARARGHACQRKRSLMKVVNAQKRKKRRKTETEKKEQKRNLSIFLSIYIYVFICMLTRRKLVVELGVDNCRKYVFVGRDDDCLLIRRGRKMIRIRKESNKQEENRIRY